MSHPHGPALPACHLEQAAALRRRAAARLPGAAGRREAAAGAHAMAVLHAMASTPDTAAQALALLHELQVQQAEIDLLAQELQQVLAEAEVALQQQAERYDAQPLACLTLDAQLRVRQLNRQAARLPGTAREQAPGLPLDGFLAAASLAPLRAAAARVDAGHDRAASPLALQPVQGGERSFVALLARDPVAGGYLMALEQGCDEPAPA